MHNDRKNQFGSALFAIILPICKKSMPFVFLVENDNIFMSRHSRNVVLFICKIDDQKGSVFLQWMGLFFVEFAHNPLAPSMPICTKKTRCQHLAARFAKGQKP